MNRKLCMTTVLIAAFAGAGATASADENTACGAVVCLFGQATGHGGGSACNKYLNPYYSIKVFDWSAFNPSKTADKRQQFLKQCRSTDTTTIAVANSNGGAENPPAPTTTVGAGNPVNPGCNGPVRCLRP
jgi:TrbM